MSHDRKAEPATRSEWLKFDEREDMVSCLEHTAEVASTLDATPMNWKWLLISLHNALQGALVCVLSGSHGTGALSTKSMKAVWEWYEAPSCDLKAKPPKEWLAPPLELYERVKQKNHMGEFGGSPIVTTHDEDYDVRRLNKLRRDFAHYTPRLWNIETVGLPRIVLNTAGVIERLVDHPALSFRLKDGQNARAHESIDRLRRRFLPYE